MNALQKCRNRLREINAEIRAINETAEDAGRPNLLASEERHYRTLKDERHVVETRIADLEANEAREAAGAKKMKDVLGGAFVSGADTVYGRESGFSYFRDLAATAQPGSPEAFEARQRLSDHAQCVDRAAADLPAEWRSSRSKRAAGAETRVNPNRTDGQGGAFVPPIFLIDEYVHLLRAGRVAADCCNVKPLPPGTDSINIPKVATGTLAATQLDAGAVASQDLTDALLTGPVRTIAGQQDVALQLLEQSPVAFDEVVFADLISDFNQKLDVQCLSGSGAAGQLTGILNVAGVNAVAYTDATPTIGELWPVLAQGMSQVAKKRYQPADCILMHPSRWYWIVGQLDTTGRPLVSPQGGSSFNSVAVLDATSAEGVVGSIGGIPVCIDANLPVNFGAGVNQDRILVAKCKDASLWEGALRTRAMVEVLSGTLQVRLQVYNYVAFIPDRYPVSYSVIDGTGLVAAAGY